MSHKSPSHLSNADAEMWRVDPGVLTWRGGKELVAYHLRTGRSYRLPSLPAQVRELLELGVALEVAAPPAPTGIEGPELSSLDYDQLLEMLEHEQLIGRVEAAAEGEAERNGRSELFLVIGSETEGPRDLSYSDVPAAPLRASTVLQRVARVVIELRSGHTHVSSEDHQGLIFSGGTQALRLLDAFERPRSVQEVVRVLQRRVRRAEGWISLVEALVRLVEGGVLREVKRDERPGGGPYAEKLPPSDRLVS